MAWIKVTAAEYAADPKKYDALVTPEDSLKVVNEDGSAGKQVHWAEPVKVEPKAEPVKVAPR